VTSTDEAAIADLRRTYDDLNVAISPNSPTRTAALANAADDLAVRLRDAGRPGEGRPYAERAAKLFRYLVRSDELQLPHLARALNNFGICLHDLKQWDEALAVKAEVVAVRRRLAERYPKRERTPLGRALMNLGNALSALDRNDEAVAAHTEAVHLLRPATPEELENSPIDRSDLAMALVNLSGVLAKLERDDEALTTVHEAMELYRAMDLSHRVESAGKARAQKLYDQALHRHKKLHERLGLPEV
jgi:tetratricopeptide (TPR) repeat protein